ncbi:hypothetical protein [Paenibacillus taichungensis]
MGESNLRSILDELRFITEDAVSRLQVMDEEELLQLANQRQDLVDSFITMKEKVTEADREQIAYILSYDPVIVARMEYLKQEAGNWLQRQGSIKQQHNAYQQNYAVDSWFIDHRK